MELKIIDDCNSLVENFVNNNSPHFESFYTQWKFLSFQHIYTAQSSTIEILQTTNVIFHVAKRMICGRDDISNKIETNNSSNNNYILRRLGGLYLMYTIYFKQPTRGFIKIQTSFQTWVDIMDFIESLQVLPNTCQARYVFWRLYQQDAFRFCALDYHVGLEDLVDFDSINMGSHNGGVGSAGLHLKYKLSDLCEAQTKLREMAKLEDNYNKIKKELTLSKTTSAEYLPISDIVHEIQGTFNTLREIIMKPTQMSTALENTNKAALRRKADNIKEDNFTMDGIPSSSSEEEGSGKSQKFKYKRAFRRMSSKSLFIEKLPDSVLNNLE